MLNIKTAAKIGDTTYNAVEEQAIKMLVVMAINLKLLQTFDNNEISEAAARVKKYCTLLALEHRNDITRALEQEFKQIFERSAMAECNLVGADKAYKEQVKKELSYKVGQSVYSAGRNISKTVNNAALDANKQFMSEAYKMAIKVRAGVVDKESAIFNAEKNLAEKGLTAYTYKTQTGRTVRVPVDVGVRRIVQDEAHAQMTEQTLQIAKDTNSELVEVSCSSAPRPSHADWEGQVYSLNGSKPNYPNFYRACNVGDPVTGYGGYNCQHQIAIFTEGVSKVFPPSKFEGMSENDKQEAYLLTQKQRRYENDLRKIKREISVRKGAGDDASELYTKMYAKQNELHNFISDNSWALHRETWREGNLYLL